MRYRHTMIRVQNLDAALAFWSGILGLIETRRVEVPAGQFTLVFLAAPEDLEAAQSRRAPELELTYNWNTDEVPRAQGRAWGQLCYNVRHIYDFCQNLMDKGLIINRPPRDGKMAFIKSPEGVSIELVQEGAPLPPAQPWMSMENKGTW